MHSVRHTGKTKQKWMNGQNKGHFKFLGMKIEYGLYCS